MQHIIWHIQQKKAKKNVLVGLAVQQFCGQEIFADSFLYEIQEGAT